MSTIKAFLAACSLGVAALAFGQTTIRLHDESVTATKRRITILQTKLRAIQDAAQKQLDAANCHVNCSPELAQQVAQRVSNEMEAAMNVVVAQIHAEVDAFIVHTVNTTHTDLDKDVVAQDLRQILQMSNDEPLSAYLLNSANRRSLIVAYGFNKGGRSSVAVWAYNETTRGVRLANTTGADMTGHAVHSIMELPSPWSGNLLLLLSGDVIGANGPNNRMRIYAYDGKKFRPIWMPENVWGRFNVKVTEFGFIVEGDYYRESRTRRDGYALHEGGLTRVDPEWIK